MIVNAAGFCLGRLRSVPVDEVLRPVGAASLLGLSGGCPPIFFWGRKLTQAKQFHCVKTMGCGRWRSDSPKRQRLAGRVLVLRRLV